MNDESFIGELYEPQSFRIDQHSVEDYIEVISNENVRASGMVIRSKDNSRTVRPERTRSSSFNHKSNAMKNGRGFLFSFMRKSMSKKHGKHESDEDEVLLPRRGEDMRPKRYFCFCCT